MCSLQGCPDGQPAESLWSRLQSNPVLKTLVCQTAPAFVELPAVQPSKKADLTATRATERIDKALVEAK
eukprot:scaffold75356_cov39-Prasinocladus_malaysianus.AAC.1